MFNFFKKSKSKDNNSTKASNVSRNNKGKQSGASTFLSGSAKKNNTARQKPLQLERDSNTEHDEVFEDLNSSRGTEGRVELKADKMGNTETKSEISSKMCGNEQNESVERKPSARMEFFLLDKNSNGIIEKTDCSPSTSTSSPTVSDLLCGTNSWESASNDRRKKESTPDSDVIFKTAPNTPVLSRDNCPRQITLPAELPSIVEDSRLPQMDTDLKQETNTENLHENRTEKDMCSVETSSNKQTKEFKLGTSGNNNEKTATDFGKNNDKLNDDEKANDKQVATSNLNITHIVENPASINDVVSINKKESDFADQFSKNVCDNLNNYTDSRNCISSNSDNNLESTSFESKLTPLYNLQDSKIVLVNDEHLEQKSETSRVSDVKVELSNHKDSETNDSGEKYNSESDSSGLFIDENSGCIPILPNCNKLLEMLSTDFPDNSRTVDENDTIDDVFHGNGKSPTKCLYGGTSSGNETSVEPLNSVGENCDSSMENNSCPDSCNDIEVSVSILMRKNGAVEDEKQQSQQVGTTMQYEGLTDTTLSKGNWSGEVEEREIKNSVENICEEEKSLSAVKILAENDNGCLVDAGVGKITSGMKSDPQIQGIGNLPKIIIESVEEQDSGNIALEENVTEENCEEIYRDESSSDEDDDSEEPLTVMERADFLLDKEKKSDDSGEGESMAGDLGEAACVRDTAAEIQEEMLDKTKEHLVNAEKRAEKQMAELKTEIEDSEKEMFRMRIQVQDLQRESITKTGGMERLQAELSAAYKESEFVRRKLKRLEEELANFKQKNSDLTEELSKKAEIENENDYWKVMELENEAKELTRRVKELEAQLSSTRAERDGLKKRVEELLAESEEERKVAQEALDEAMAEKLVMQEKYEREFEKLRSANIDREQKMLDDFEWKLREVEQACKKRLDDKEQTSRQQVREVEGKLTVAEGKLAQFPHLKQCEQELNHLRERSIEQQRSLRTATRQLEQLQDSDKQQHEEIQQLKQLLEKEKSHLTTVQSIHYRELAEKDRKLQFKLDQQKTEINSDWEDKMKRETQRIKTETERNHKTEKFQALYEAKSQHQQKLKEIESSWQKKHLVCVKEIDSLKTKLCEKEDYYKQEFETIQTKADRDIFELRRKLDKIDMSYQEQIEKMQQKHEKELEKVRDDADRRIQQCELNAQHQVGASRTTIELVKEQMQRESQEKLQQLSEHHRRQLEEQWEQLVQERDEAIAMIEQKHRTSMEKLRNELDSIYKGRNTRETELLDTLSQMRLELSGKTSQIGGLETNVEELQGNLEVLNCEVNNKAQQITKVMQEGEEVLRQREQQLQETFHSQLEEMSARHRKEIGTWQNNVDELNKKIAALTKRDENKDNSSAAKRIDELVKQLKEKEQQIATLSKEKHLYQLELMNKDKESVQAKQRRKGGRGRQGGRGQRC